MVVMSMVRGTGSDTAVLKSRFEKDWEVLFREDLAVEELESMEDVPGAAFISSRWL